MRSVRLAVAWTFGLMVMLVAVFQLSTADSTQNSALSPVLWPQDFPFSYVLDQMETKPGQYVADVGCARGEFTIEIALRVGSRGIVLAEDISREAVSFVHDRAIEQKLWQIKPLLGTPTDPQLPTDSLDAVFMANAYAHMSNRGAMIRRIGKSLKQGGRMAMIDRLPRKLLAQEAKAAGLELYSLIPPQQTARTDFSFMIFTRR